MQKKQGPEKGCLREIWYYSLHLTFRCFYRTISSVRKACCALVGVLRLRTFRCRSLFDCHYHYFVEVLCTQANNKYSYFSSLSQLQPNRSIDFSWTSFFILRNQNFSTSFNWCWDFRLLCIGSLLQRNIWPRHFLDAH